jgi:hypothetical protein
MPLDEERQSLLKTGGHTAHEQPAITPNYTTFPDAKPRTSKSLRWLQLGLLTFWRSCHVREMLLFPHVGHYGMAPDQVTFRIYSRYGSASSFPRTSASASPIRSITEPDIDLNVV